MRKMLKFDYPVSDLIKLLKGWRDDFYNAGFSLTINQAYIIDLDNTKVKVFRHFQVINQDVIKNMSEIVGEFELTNLKKGCILTSNENYIQAGNGKTYLQNFLDRLTSKLKFPIQPKKKSEGGNAREWVIWYDDMLNYGAKRSFEEVSRSSGFSVGRLKHLHTELRRNSTK